MDREIKTVAHILYNLKSPNSEYTVN
jgi:hypothetical protein